MNRDVNIGLYIDGELSKEIIGKYIGTGYFGLASAVCLENSADKVRTVNSLVCNLTDIISTTDFPHRAYEIRINLGEEK